MIKKAPKASQRWHLYQAVTSEQNFDKHKRLNIPEREANMRKEQHEGKDPKR